MARLNLRLKENAPGPLYVDETCIDCDTCRQMAPEIYGESRGLSYVMRQPESADEQLRALQALVACPTASIGSAFRYGIPPASDFANVIKSGSTS